MKIIQANEVASINVKSVGAKRQSQNVSVYELMRNLTVGQGLVIDKSEWVGKSKPFPSQAPKPYRTSGASYQVKTLADESGWMIVRAN